MLLFSKQRGHKRSHYVQSSYKLPVTEMMASSEWKCFLVILPHNVKLRALLQFFFGLHISPCTDCGCVFKNKTNAIFIPGFPDVKKGDNVVIEKYLVTKTLIGKKSEGLKFEPPAGERCG